MLRHTLAGLNAWAPLRVTRMHWWRDLLPVGSNWARSAALNCHCIVIRPLVPLAMLPVFDAGFVDPPVAGIGVHGAFGSATDPQLAMRNSALTSPGFTATPVRFSGFASNVLPEIRLMFDVGEFWVPTSATASLTNPVAVQAGSPGPELRWNSPQSAVPGTFIMLGRPQRSTTHALRGQL